MRAMEISRTGLDVEWRRLEVIAENLANMNTTRAADGGVYRPMRLISGPRAGFSQYLDQTAQPNGVAVYGLEAERVGTRRAYEPQNPDADTDGFVTYPDIDEAGAMTQMIKTERSYEANLVAFNIARQMFSKALDLGRRS